ncbi:NAD-dependent epimerase/dehydratase family protein [Motiliproteus coralliicola]|uniref:NAD-dependent epimerase/dehydratase family protein n=1 Tax=Motiliproteus coralliicola TaxID=2283196 RepID=A0A369WLZ2_9GAMM|nr:SDR family oxidoreductase [Motiliproteus coralliicola]RDE23090.1 NAD-dependent epimerase/dehydratase family protein [Motiliproteus coralliicola]
MGIESAASQVMVTGASGFIGRHLVRSLSQSGYQVVACVRDLSTPFNSSMSGLKLVQMKDLGEAEPWSEEVFHGVDVIVHAAARVHVLADPSSDPLACFRRDNTLATLRLAERAAQHGVRRLIYISSIKVNGEQTAGEPYTASDIPAPEDAYGISKAEAESALFAVAENTGLEVVVIRPPLVYGPGVSANFWALRNWIKQGYPLPFGATDNRRSLVNVFNLVDLIQLCISHPKAANEVFLVSDGESISTANLIRRIAKSLGRTIWLPRIPVPCLEFIAAVLGRGQIMRRLCSDLEVDIQKTSKMLGWEPSVSMEQALQCMEKEL